MSTCVTCHGVDGKAVAQGGKALTAALGFADIVNTVTNGRNNKPPFGNVMPQADMQDVASCLVNALLKR